MCFFSNDNDVVSAGCILLDDFLTAFVSTGRVRNIMSLHDLHEGDGDHSQPDNYNLLSLVGSIAGATVNWLAMAKPVQNWHGAGEDW